MDVLMLNVKKDNFSENLSKKINLKYGLYCIRGEDFSGIYKTGNFENLLKEIYRLARLSYKEEQEVIITAC